MYGLLLLFAAIFLLFVAVLMALLAAGAFGAELVDDDALILLSRGEGGIRPAAEVALVGRVGELLRFEANGGAVLDGFAVLAFYSAVEEVARIYLDAGFVSEDVHADACQGADERGGEGDAALAFVFAVVAFAFLLTLFAAGFAAFLVALPVALTAGFVEHPVVVVALAEAQLLVVGVDVLPDGFRRGEVERCAGHGSNLAGGHEGGIDGGVVVGIEAEQMVSDGGAVAVEVEVEVAAGVDDGFLVRGGSPLHGQLAAGGEGVLHLTLDGAGEASLAVGAHERHGDAVVGHFLHVHHLVLPAHVVALEAELLGVERATAVQAVAEVVLRQLVLCAVEGNLTSGDTVGIASDGGAEVTLDGAVGLDAGLADADVLQLALLVGHHDADHACAEVRHAHLHACFVAQRVEVGFLPLQFGLEVGTFQPAQGHSFFRCCLAPCQQRHTADHAGKNT